MKASIEYSDRQVVMKQFGAGMSEHETEVLQYCLLMSADICTGWIDDKAVCCWGLVPPTLMSERAYIWLYATEAVEEHQFTFVRNSQRWVEAALRVYPCIYGHVMVDNPRAIRWLKWLGAELGCIDGKGISFQIRRKDG